MRTVPGRAALGSSSARPAARWRTSSPRNIPTIRRSAASSRGSSQNVRKRSAFFNYFYFLFYFDKLYLFTYGLENFEHSFKTANDPFSGFHLSIYINEVNLVTQ
jgi:hypothetical protein